MWPGVGEKFDARLVEIEQRILTFPAGAAVVENVARPLHSRFRGNDARALFFMPMNIGSSTRAQMTHRYCARPNHLRLATSVD